MVKGKKEKKKFAWAFERKKKNIVKEKEKKEGKNI